MSRTQYSKCGYIRRRNGFTLLECLVVIAILTILIILAIPVVQRAITKGQQVGCINHLRQLHQALSNYATEHGGKYPLAQNSDDGQMMWLGYLREGGYIPNHRTTDKPSQYISFCPGSKVRQSNGFAADHLGQYGINRSIVGQIKPNGVNPQVPIQSISEPSKKLLLVDCGTFIVYLSVVTSSGGTSNYIPGMKANAGVAWPPLYQTDAVEGRHGGRINALMADGHVESFTPDDFLNAAPSILTP